MVGTELLLEMASELGFDLAGIAPLRPPTDGPRFAHWLAAGHHGELEYLERNRDRILDPGQILPEGRSLLVVGLAHSRPEGRLADGTAIARYALGADYHNTMTRRLRKLARRLENEGMLGRARAIVDAGPLLERSHAREAGLGFGSKAANLLHPRFGPWFFLGELLLPIELDPTPTPPNGSCGTCSACLDICPTQAIQAPGLVHAPDCISYQTIEQRGAIPHELRHKHGPWLFGCDLCSQVCPWGREAPDMSQRFGRHPALETSAISLLRSTAPVEVFQGSPLRRAGKVGLARNAAIVLGNLPREEGRVALLQALSDDRSALVREAAHWALAQGHSRDAGVREALAAAYQREVDAPARVDMAKTLERLA